MTQSMRVLWISDYFPRPHDETTGVWALETVQALRRQGVEVAVLSPTPWIPGWLAWTKTLRGWADVPPQWQVDGVEVFFARCLHYPHRLITQWFYHRLPWLDSTVVWWGCRRRIAELLRQFPAQVVHANFMFPSGYLALRIKEAYGIPFIAHERSPQRLEAARRYPWRGRIYRRVLREASAVITMNPGMAATLRQMAPAQARLHVIRSGARMEAPAAATGEPVRRDGAKTVLSVGALSERKGHEYLIRAVAALRHDLPGVRCRIIGRGPRREALAALISDLGVGEAVELCGARPHEEVLREMASCDAFALPSWGESSGTAYAEALSFGKPVIACEGEGLSDLIRDGINGLLVKPRDAASLAQALRRVLGDAEAARRIGEQGRRIAQQEMNYDVIAGRMLGIYREAGAS